MRKLLLGSIALLALGAGGSAPAADVRLPVYKAPPPVAVYSWTGFYVGGNIGYSWGKADTDVAIPGFTVDERSAWIFRAQPFRIRTSSRASSSPSLGGRRCVERDAGYCWGRC